MMKACFKKDGEWAGSPLLRLETFCGKILNMYGLNERLIWDVEKTG